MSTPKEDRSLRSLIEEQTEIRRALLRNGYSPFPCAGKNKQMLGWQHIHATKEMIDGWSDQMKWVSTAVHAGVNRLVGLDVDIDDPDVLADFESRIPEQLWEKLKDVPRRLGGGVKEMWLVRLAEGESPRRAKETTGKWGDPDSGENDSDHKLEIFPKPHRVLALYGARLVEDRTPTSWYRWVDGRGPDTIPISDLPEITNSDIVTLLDCAVAAMQAKGWDRLDVPGAGGDDDSSDRVFDLVDGMTFRTQSEDEINLAELEELCHAVGEVRLYSWLPGKRRRGDRCCAKINDYDGLLQIYDHDTEKLHRKPEADGAYRRGMAESFRTSVAALAARLSAPVEDEGAEGETGGLEGRAMSRLEKLAESVPAEERVFQSVGSKEVVDLSGGRLTNATFQVAEALSELDYMYDMGGRVVAVFDGAVREMSEPRLALEIGKIFDCVKLEQRAKSAKVTSVDPTTALVKQVLAYAPEAGFRSLRGVVDVPILTGGGEVVDGGYNPESRLLVSDSSGAAQYLSAVDMSEDALRAALETLWRPFSEFPFVGAGDRGGALACALTAVSRAWLPTAPMFAFDAPVQGSGKSLLCRAIGALSGRCMFSAPLPIKNEDEIRKRLMSMLMSGPSAVIYDNQIGILDSASLAAVLTSETFADRELGHSRILDMPTSVLVMVNGNNMALGGDMPRRTVRVRIDPQMDTPFERSFGFDPETWVREHRGEMVAAALTILQWGLQRAEKGRVGSFEKWDQVVGQTVARVGRELDVRFGDPAEVIRTAHEDDPRRDELGDLLSALRDEFGNKWFTASEVSARMVGSGVTAPLVEAFGYDKVPSARSIGRHLTFRRDARMHGMSIQLSTDTKANVRRFRIWGDEDADGVVVSGAIEQRRGAQKGRLGSLVKPGG